MTFEELSTAVVYLISRYLHIVCTACLVGGTLFYEMVVPAAVSDMPESQQLAVMGRSRWVFRWIVWLSCLLLLASGVMSTVRHWPTYSESPNEEPVLAVYDSDIAAGQAAQAAQASTQPATAPSATEPTPAAVDASPSAAPVHPQPAARFKLRSGWWFVAHVSTSLIAIFIAVSLTLGPTPPARPVQWMRMNLVILLIVIFLGSVAREVRLAISERQHAANGTLDHFVPGPLAPVENERD